MSLLAPAGSCCILPATGPTLLITEGSPLHLPPTSTLHMSKRWRPRYSSWYGLSARVSPAVSLPILERVTITFTLPYAPKRLFISVGESEISFGKDEASAMFLFKVQWVRFPSVIQSH